MAPWRLASTGHLCPCSRSFVSAVPDDEARWAFEVKWDGIRLLARIDHGELTVITRNLIHATARYPDLAGLGSALAKQSAVLDGELVAFDASGHATFEALQQRMDPEGGKPATTRGGAGIAYMVFDVLALDGRSLLSAPYVERRAGAPRGPRAGRAALARARRIVRRRPRPASDDA